MPARLGQGFQQGVSGIFTPCKAFSPVPDGALGGEPDSRTSWGMRVDRFGGNTKIQVDAVAAVAVGKDQSESGLSGQGDHSGVGVFVSALGNRFARVI